MMINLTYVLGLIYYYRKLRSTLAEDVSNLKTNPPVSHSPMEEIRLTSASL